MAAAAAAAAEPHGRPKRPVLRLCTHNVNGIGTAQAAEEAAGYWRRAGFDMVLIQEHHLTILTQTAVARRLAKLGWTIHIAVTPSEGQAKGGTAVAYRTSLVTGGSLVLEDGTAAVRRGAEGRYVAAPFLWSGHRLHVASVYLPSGDAAAQKAYVTAHLQPLEAAARASGRALLWGGDWNFAPQPHLDRLRHAPGAPHQDIGTQQHWSDALPSLVDVWRHKHPGRRGYTFTRALAGGGGSAARLDRFYATDGLLAAVAYTTINARSPSDHRPVALTLIGCQAAEMGPRRPRTRLGFVGTPLLEAQLRTWLAAEAAAAPVGHTTLLAWWPQFKHRMARKCGELHAASRRMSAEAEVAGAELEALAAELDEGGDDDALAAVVAARQRFAAAARASEASGVLRQRQKWYHTGERPCPLLTRKTRPPAASRQVPYFIKPGGQLAATGRAMAQFAARAYAAVSEQPVTTPAARDEVLAALATGPKLSAGHAANLGRHEVTAADVKAALKSSPSGRSPGHDGLPLELWRTFKSHLAPLLARLYTAINAAGAFPSRFHEGLITLIHKSGPRTDPLNYRPITLLCTDYRVYAKLLAQRLNPLLPSLIDREQTAFVPGRRIGENILAVQCLAELLRRQGRWALVVFCDFRKAYDTVCRGFLLDSMATMGLGDGFLAMVRRMLTGTTTRAEVNGWASTPVAFAAGVRQGCPLAPLLYLCIAQALLRLLKSRGIGIDAAGLRLAALQYADDTKPFLPSLAQLPALLDALATFGDASGQRLNVTKTRALPIGAAPPGLPASAHGLQVVSAAKALGVTFGSDADPTAAWPDLVAGVERCYARLAFLPKSFSVFGRGFATAAYGVSKMLYHAEFTGGPPDERRDRLARSTARLVDRRLPPEGGPPRFAGLASWLLPGRPIDGGFGALPLGEHITSRHAWWGLRLITEAPTVPWVAVARALLRAYAPEGGGHPLGLLVWPPGQPLPGALVGLPEPLRRLHAALARLPRAGLVGPEPLGPWSLEAPLWGNPCFASPAFPAGIDSSFEDILATRVGTLGQLLTTHRAVVGALGSAAAYHPVWATRLHGYPPFADRYHALERLEALLAALPPTWVAAAQQAAAAVAAGQLAAPMRAQALGEMLSRLGWELPGAAQPLTLPTFTVRGGTRLLTAPTEAHRDTERLEPFAQIVGGTLVELRALLDQYWRLPWDNCNKEPFWRLMHNAFPTAARMHLADQTCCCGGAHADRQHHFWDCPVAAAVRASVSAALAELDPAAPPVSQPQLWLGRVPGGVHMGVWRVVCLAAIAAMDSGRRRMVALTRSADGPIEPPPHRPTITATSGRFAVRRFWSSLADFVGLGRAPASWRERCPPGHPFLSYDPHTNAWSVDRPAFGPATPDQ